MQASLVRGLSAKNRGKPYFLHKSTKISEMIAWVEAHRKINGSKLKPVLYDRGRYFSSFSTLKLYLIEKGGIILPNMSLMMLKIYSPTALTLEISKMALSLRFTRQFDLWRPFYGKKMTFFKNFSTKQLYKIKLYVPYKLF